MLMKGCDPGSITLFGHSAGSGDILFHALSPHSKPLIKRVIMQSGSGLAHWALKYEQHLLDLTAAANPTSPTYEKMFKIYKNSRYVNSINNTLLNFVSITTCDIAEKNVCLKSKLAKYLNHQKGNFNLSRTQEQLARLQEKLAELSMHNNFLTEQLQKLDEIQFRFKELKLKVALWGLLKNMSNFNDFALMFSVIFQTKFLLINNFFKTNPADPEEYQSDARLLKVTETFFGSRNTSDEYLDLVSFLNTDRLVDEHFLFNKTLWHVKETRTNYKVGLFLVTINI